MARTAPSFGLIMAWAATMGCASSTSSEPRLSEKRIALRLIDTDGRSVSLAAQRGRVVLLHMIATWSDPALVEVPLLASLQDRYPEDLVVWGVSLDTDPEMIQIFRSTFDVPYPVLYPMSLARFTSGDGPFGPITVIPTSILLNREGRIAARMDGLWPPQALTQAVQDLVDLDRKVAGDPTNQ